MFTDDYEFLIKLLTPLSQHKDLLANWDQTGGLMLDFAKLSVHYNQLISLNDPISIKNNLTTFRSAILNVRSRIKAFPPLTYIHNVCLAEMSGRIAVMLRKLLNVMDHHTYDTCTDAAINAQTLPVTDDNLKQEMNSILIDFLNYNQPKASHVFKNYCT